VPTAWHREKKSGLSKSTNHRLRDGHIQVARLGRFCLRPLRRIFNAIFAGCHTELGWGVVLRARRGPKPRGYSPARTCRRSATIQANPVRHQIALDRCRKPRRTRTQCSFGASARYDCPQRSGYQAASHQPDRPHVYGRAGGSGRLVGGDGRFQGPGDLSAGMTRCRRSSVRRCATSAVTEGAVTPSAVVCQSSSVPGAGAQGGRAISRYSANPSM
jgi:hypothetical protein